jgi:hypothetical protein
MRKVHPDSESRTEGRAEEWGFTHAVQDVTCWLVLPVTQRTAAGSVYTESPVIETQAAPGAEGVDLLRCVEILFGESGGSVGNIRRAMRRSADAICLETEFA